MADGTERSIGFWGATGIGVGAIVGGGILALAGVAFAAAGPSALIAFVLNGIIAFLTAMSFAELATSYPRSGGTYTFAKRVLNIRSAFLIGWVVWFASIVAAVLYALGFASYVVVTLETLWPTLMGGAAPLWLGGRLVSLALALAATAFYTLMLMRSSGGGGSLETIGKVIVFAIIIAGGLWALVGEPPITIREALTPFFPGGFSGIAQAMGFTFIAFQGFDLIAAAAGEVKDPERNLPRSMILSLVIAMVVYLPLLFVVMTVGVAPGDSIVALSQANPETVVAVAAQNFMGGFGFWLVVVAALLAMLSALQANIFAASRVALAMARDRTLPRQLSFLHAQRGTPALAVLASAGMIVVILLVIPNVAAAGAAASLIFLLTFTLAHWATILARRRAGDRPSPYRTPFFPLVPAVGGIACALLAVFQGIVVPEAGIISSLWIAIGLGAYFFYLAPQAKAADALAEAQDPHLVQLRGRSPLVLVPIANPASAAAMVSVAQALAPTSVGRVLLLSVVKAQRGQTELPEGLRNTQAVLETALRASMTLGLYPEALTTVAADPWVEISRVATLHRCESLLLGLTSLAEKTSQRYVDTLMSRTDADVSVLRAPQGWQLGGVRRILIPIGGGGGQDILRARLLGSLNRTSTQEITYLRVMPEGTPEPLMRRARRQLERLAEDETLGEVQVEVVENNDAISEIAAHAQASDLMILGLTRVSRRHKMLGDFALKVANKTDCAIIMISRRG